MKDRAKTFKKCCITCANWGVESEGEYLLRRRLTQDGITVVPAYYTGKEKEMLDALKEIGINAICTTGCRGTGLVQMAEKKRES